MKEKNETSAGGIVYKVSGTQIFWLVTQHSEHKGWVFPKGLVGDTEAGETREAAALREVEEEGGVKAKIMAPDPIETSYSYEWQKTQVHKKVYYYLMQYLSGDPKDHDWEMMDAKFVTAEEAMNMLRYQADRDAFSQAVSLWNKRNTDI